MTMTCLQCFDTVGWAAGRASCLQKTECNVNVNVKWSIL